LLQSELYRLCGLVPFPKPRPQPWVQAQLQFIGAEGYVLGTKRIEVRIAPGREGICLTTKGRMSLNASTLLGSKIKVGKLYDVMVVTDSVTMSLAKLCPGMYPVVLRTDNTVMLN
jgi:hypothetical protein